VRHFNIVADASTRSCQDTCVWDNNLAVWNWPPGKLSHRHVVAASMVRSWCGIGLLAFVTALESLTRGKQIVFAANDLQYHWIFVLDFDVSVQLVWHRPPGMLLSNPFDST
jgi:DNA-binding transcriptional LysR family regulator